MPPPLHCHRTPDLSPLTGRDDVSVIRVGNNIARVGHNTVDLYVGDNLTILTANDQVVAIAGLDEVVTAMIGFSVENTRSMSSASMSSPDNVPASGVSAA